MTLADRIVVMNAGRSNRSAARRALPSRRQNLFVARFIGTPAMNFIPARLVGDGDRLAVVVEDAAQLCPCPPPAWFVTRLTSASPCFSGSVPSTLTDRGSPVRPDLCRRATRRTHGHGNPGPRHDRRDDGHRALSSGRPGRSRKHDGAGSRHGPCAHHRCCNGSRAVSGLAATRLVATVAGTSRAPDLDPFCQACGGTLEARVESPAKPPRRASRLLDFADLLPLGTGPVSLGEGGTPRLPLDPALP